MKIKPALARFLVPAFAALATLASTPASRAAVETVVINSSTTITFGAYKSVSGTLAYEIADGQVLKLAYDEIAASSQNVGILYPSANARIIIGPSGTAGTGSLLIEDVHLTSASGQGVLSSMASGATGAVLEVTNATFRNNRTNGSGAIIFINNASSQVFLKNVLFEGNSTAVDSGVIRMQRAAGSNLLSVTSGTFVGNYASTNFAVLDVSGTVLLTDVLFSNNRARRFGGAIGANSGGYLTDLVLTDVVFKDNWAGRQGGALWGPVGNGRTMVLRLTGSGGVTNYEYTGNHAGGLTGDAQLADLQSGVLSSAAIAAGGGFYWASTTGTLVFDIASGVTLAIGEDAGAQAGGAHDSIASSANTARMAKIDAGTLVLNADNSYWRGTFDIRQGAVVLGNAAAKLGGTVNVANGGILAGTGTLSTTHATEIATLNIAGGGVVQIGALSGATGGQTLTLDGNLNLAANAIIRFDLFAGGISDQFIVNGAITQSSGTGIIDINSLIPGTYDLGNATDLATFARVTIAGIEQSAGARQTATLGVAGDSLILTAAMDISRALAWAAASGTWNTGADNWAGTNSVTKFAVGDRVLFSPAASSTITLAGIAPFTVADITVNSAAELLFTGSAGIIADPSSVFAGDNTDPGRITDATGKLTKAGAGALVFANTGNNSFKGGIELEGGTLAFNNAAQIDTTGTNIRATGDATLRADADIAALANTIAIEAGRTLTLDTQEHTVAFTGALASNGAFAKAGAGTLTFSGNSSAFAGTTLVNAGRLMLNNARLGGSLTLAPGAALAGTGTVGGALNLGAGSLIDVGTSSSAPGTLAIGGILTLDGATLTFDLHGRQSGTGAYISDQITATGLALTSGTVKVGAFQSGTYTIGVIAGLDSVANLSTNLTLDLDAPGRQGAALSVAEGDKLMLITMADISRVLTWNGSGVSWADIGGWDGSKDQFASGDRVAFDATATAAGRAITLANMTYVSDMIVTGDGYTFAGAGGITSGARHVSNTGAAEFGDTATGKLTKTGDVTLTFANTGGNMFEGGIDLEGGMIVFSNPNQLATGSGAAINFIETGTLRTSAATVNGTLNAGLAIADGRTAVFDAGGTIALTGAITGGPSATLSQGVSGGTLVLSGDSAGYTGATAVSGAVLLNEGALGGTVSIANGAAFGGRGDAPGTVNAAAGATVRIGFTGADASEELHIARLRLASGATVTGHGIWSGAASVEGLTSSVRVDSGRTIFLAAEVTGAGDLVKNGSGTLEITTGRLLTKRVLVEAGTLAFAGNSINVERLGILPAGVLAGVGTVTASGLGGVENAGQIRVGRAGGHTTFGALSIAGDYTGVGGSIVLAIGNGQARKDTINFAGAISGSAAITVLATEAITTSANLPRDLVTHNGGISGISVGMFNVTYSGTGADTLRGVRVTDSGWLYAYDPASGMWGSTHDPIPLVPPALGLHAATLLSGKAALDSMDRHLDASRDEIAGGEPRTFRLWLQGVYRRDTLTTGIYKNASNEITGAQAGADWNRRVGSKGDTTLALGLFAEHTGSTMDRLRGGATSKLDAAGGGIYAQLSGLRWHVNAVLRGANHDFTITLPDESDTITKGPSWSGALGAGFLLVDRAGWNMEPRVRLAFQSSKIDDAIDSRDMLYQMEDARSLEMRAGLRLWRQWEYCSGRFLTPHARLDLVHETKGSGYVTVGGDRFENNLGGAGFEAGIGLTMQISRAFSANAQASWADNSKAETASFTLGVSCVW